MNKQVTPDPEPSSAVPPVSQDPPSLSNVPAPVIRTATQEQFKKAHEKTSAQHAGLFRRLAE